MSYAKSLLDDTDNGAHLTSSLAECQRAAGTLQSLGQGRMCPVVWDGWLCWPPTLAGAIIRQSCPDIHGFDTQQFVYRSCMTNGTWYGSSSVGRHDNTGWSNYSLCVGTASMSGAILPGGYNVTTTGYDAEQTVSTLTSSVVQFLEETKADMTLPLTDIVGSASHGVSVVCLLLALVVWVTLKLTDRLVTGRYLVMLATIVTSFLFHTIVLSSRLRAVAIALSVPSHVSPSPSAPLVSDHHHPLTRNPRHVESILSTPAVVSAHTPHLQSGDMFQNQRPLKRVPAELYGSELGDPVRTSSVSSDAVSVPRLRPNHMQESKAKEESGTIPRRSKIVRSQADGLVMEQSLNKKEEGVGAGDRSVSDQPWLTLCQVGRAFYLLSDLAVYSFLFSMSLYYTLVVLGKELTFNRLVTMFLLGGGLPVVFVIFTILLYTFLPTHNAFGTTCIVDSLVDDFHWAITAPKLMCVVLSLCLMTVSTYGFWKLHIPALHTTSEAFYARQGVLKTLALLLACSLAELFYLVTEYQKMYEWMASPYVEYTSTALFGLKGCVLAFLFCFVDCEILHGTCCSPSADDGEPWLRSAPPCALKGDGRGGQEEGRDEGAADGVQVDAKGTERQTGWSYSGSPKQDVIGSTDIGEKV